MRGWMLMGWLLAPVALGAYHYGPGQTRLQLDDVSATLAEADAAAETDPRTAIERYSAALAQLPADHVEAQRRVRHERAKAQMLVRQLPEARAELEALVAELEADKQADPQFRADARHSLASAQYYMTWLMRLEGLPPEEWEPEIDAARQNFKLLASEAEASGRTLEAQQHREDLEAAVRLARLEPGALQGRPLPKQCSGCKSGQCKKPGKKPGKSKDTGPKDARGASSGPPPDGQGT